MKFFVVLAGIISAALAAPQFGIQPFSASGGAANAAAQTQTVNQGFAPYGGGFGGPGFGGGFGPYGGGFVQPQMSASSANAAAQTQSFNSGGGFGGGMSGSAANGKFYFNQEFN